MKTSSAIQRRHFLARMLGFITGSAWLGSKAGVRDAAAQDLPYLGEIRMFAGDFAPQNWALCDGQLLSIAQYDALFSLIGTTYGGDGQVTFALPDLRGRAPVHIGPANQLGVSAGQETVTLQSAQIPAHSHALMGSSGVGDADNPSGRVPARNAVGAPHYHGGMDTTLASNALTLSGSSMPHNNMMPSLCVNFIICLEGVFPSQS